MSNAFLSGIIIGSLYAAMALGLTIIYGVIRIFNFSHGVMGVMAGYFSLFFLTHVGLSLPLAIAISLVIMFFFGLALYKVAISYLLKKPNWEFSNIVFLLGLAILTENLLLKAFGPRVKALPRFFEESLSIGFLQIRWHDLSLLILVIVFVIALNLFLKRTWIGQAMRAVAQEMTGAKVVGINIDRTFGLAFAIATTVTGLGGVLLATRYFLMPDLGWGWMFKGFIVVVFGSLGSATGAIYAAFILGMTEAFIGLFLDQTWVWPIWFIIFLGVLIIKPQGLFGGRTI